MQLLLLSTAYHPPISWMATAIKSENISIEIYETYPKQTFRNRCNISTSTGILGLTVPVKRINGNHTKTIDIHVDNSGNWQQLHWRSILTAYNKSPYLIFYRDLIEPIYLKKYKYLIDLNQELITLLFKILKLRNINIDYTKQYNFKPDEVDLRNCFHPKKNSCQFIQKEFPKYIQTFETDHVLIPNLSIIDLIFNMGPDAVNYLSDLKFSLRELNETKDTQF